MPGQPEDEDKIFKEQVRKIRTATLILATKSAIEFPAAKIVRPMIASDSPKIKPKV